MPRNNEYEFSAKDAFQVRKPFKSNGRDYVNGDSFNKDCVSTRRLCQMYVSGLIVPVVAKDPAEATVAIHVEVAEVAPVAEAVADVADTAIDNTPPAEAEDVNPFEQNQTSEKRKAGRPKQVK